MNILVVEDNPVTMTILKANLEKKGYDVQKAYNGKHAIGVINNFKKPLDIIITDVMMPEMDGFQFVRHIKNQEKFKKIPIIMCTAVKDLEYVTKAKELGIRHYTLKPLVMEKLFLRLDEILIEDSSKAMEMIQDTEVNESVSQEIALSFSKLVEDKITFLEYQSIEDESEELSKKLSDLKEAAENFGTKWITKIIENLEMVQQEQNGKLDADQRFKLLRELKKLHAILPSIEMSDEKITTVEKIDDFRKCINKYAPAILDKFEDMVKRLGYVKPTTCYVEKVDKGMVAFDDVWGTEGKLLIARGMEVNNKMMTTLGHYHENSNVIEPFRMVSFDQDLPQKTALNTDIQKTIPIHLPSAMEIVDGDINLYQELFDEYLTRLSDQITRIQDCINKKDGDRLQREAHDLKGSSRNLCADQIAKYVIILENKAKSNDFQNIDKVFNSMKKAIEDTTEYYLNIKWDKVSV